MLAYPSIGRRRRLRALLSCLVPVLGWAAIPIDEVLLVSGYTEDFDGLPSENFTWANDGTLPGWSAVTSANAVNTSARAATGGGNLNDLTLYSIGADSDRALTYHTRVAATDTYLGLALVNGLDRGMTGFSLSYTPEQWRENTDGRTLSMAVEYRVGATAADLASGTGWTALPGMVYSTQGGAAGATATLSSGSVAAAVPAGSSLWIRWKLSNDAASSTSSHDILAIDNVAFAAEAEAVEAAPVFTTQPSLKIVAVGDPASFFAEASGYPAPEYQWYREGEPVSGATGTTLTIASAQLADAGAYTVVATNSVDSETSETATLTVSATPLPPVVTVDPVSQIADAGSDVTFSVVATGSGPLGYQWSKDGEEISGAESATLELTGIGAAAAGTYSVAVSNVADTVTSAGAVLAVNLPPSIVTDPIGQSVAAGANVSFSVVAEGAAPFGYKWFKDGDALLGETTSTLDLSAVSAGQSGIYTVEVSNSLGSALSAGAVLTVEAPPVIAVPPAAVQGILGGTAIFSVQAVGAGPFTYVWKMDGATLLGQTAPTLQLGPLGFDAAGDYAVTVSNAFGSTTSASAALSVSAALPVTAFSLTGFGEATTGGGVLAETDPGYVKVSTPLEFVTALADKTGGVKVIEVMNDLDLGYLEVEPAVREFGNFRQHATPKIHPVLKVTGVALIDIQNKSGLTLFSAHGATIRHATLNFKSSHNLIIRNLKFDELWEWDEASKGDYDSNDWDFINLGNAGTVWDVWIDHCTFTKAYDGIVDIKGGSYNITFSWCRYIGDDGATNPNSFVRQQINWLEANRPANGMYEFLRTRGFSVEDIVAIHQGPDKTHLIGANSLSDDNLTHTVTFHHQWFENTWDRLPRLRGGNVHNYNIFVDAEVARQAKALRDARVAAMAPSDAAQLSSSGQYNFNVFLNGSISTEDAAILVEKSYYLDVLTPLRNNQTDPLNPIYTGKILGLDCITRMTDNNGVSTTVRGDSTDPGNPMGPFQAPIKPFSWNLPGNVLPYHYTMDDPADLPEILALGAGAGRLTWDKENWLKTTYAQTSRPTDEELPAYAFGYLNGGSGPIALPTIGAANTTPLIRFFRLRPDVIYTVEASADLSLWDTLAVDPGTIGDWVEVLDTEGTGSFPRFLRIHLELAP